MDIIAASEKIGIYRNWYSKLDGGDTFKLWVGQEIKDDDNTICKIVDKTSNSVCVFITRKPKEVVKKTKKTKAQIELDLKIPNQFEEEDDDRLSKGIDCNQWFTIVDFYKRFKI